MEINKDELSVFSDLSCLPKLGENKVLPKPAENKVLPKPAENKVLPKPAENKVFSKTTQSQKNLINSNKIYNSNSTTISDSSLDSSSDSSSISENTSVNISRVTSNIGLNNKTNIPTLHSLHADANSKTNSKTKSESTSSFNTGITNEQSKSHVSSDISTFSTNTSSFESIITSSNDSSCSSDKSNDICKNLLNNVISKEQLLNKIHIDVAVVCEDYNNIDLMCEDHIICLDEIDITMEMFQLMFYPYKENFGINKDFFINNIKFMPFISFFPDFRSVNGKKFYLLEQLITNIETDLNVPRFCFTKDSLVELTNQITCIKTLLDIKCCSVLSSLTWTNILDIIRNYNYIHEKVIPILVVNIIFKTPTNGVKDTIIRFQYKIC
jgi:hypothetical protein